MSPVKFCKCGRPMLVNDMSLWRISGGYYCGRCVVPCSVCAAPDWNQCGCWTPLADIAKADLKGLLARDGLSLGGLR